MPTGVTAWLPDFFARLWSEIEPQTGALSTDGWLGREAKEAEAIERLLLASTLPGVPNQIAAYLSGIDPLEFGRCAVPGEQAAQRTYVVAQCIDRVFERIHPRSRPAALARGSALIAFRRHRTTNGHYSKDESGGLVIPKAPLRSGDRLRPESSGDRIDAHFQHLTVVRWQDARYRLEFQIAPTRRSRRAPATPLAVGFAPLAQDRDDLTIDAQQRGAQAFIGFRPNPASALDARARACMKELDRSGVHIAMFPEWCVGDEPRRAIQDALKAAPSATLSLVVAGSGLCDRDPMANRPFNQSVVFDGDGRELWRQEKLHHYDMQPDARVKYVLPSVAGREGDVHREDFASGNVLRFYEHPFLGRLTVLICEDLNQPNPGRRACEAIQPDWVFAPVLDGPIAVGRWSHRGAWDLAERFGTRVIVANSMTLAQRMAPPPPTCGIGLCVDDANPRRVQVVSADTAGATIPIVRVATWDPDAWKEVRVVT